MAIEFTRWFLAILFTMAAGFYTARILFAIRRRGRSPVFVGRPGTLHYWTYLAFRVFRVAIWLVCVARLALPEADRLIGAFYSLWTPPILWTGNALLVMGVILVLFVHFYMGRDWHSGTRAEDHGHLLTTGPFALSRNPMLLAVQIGQVGLFLALPSAFTLTCLAVGLWAVHAQVRVEERVLAVRHGGAYDDYREQTPRWLVR